MIAAAAAAIALFASSCASTPAPRRSDGKAHELVDVNFSQVFELKNMFVFTQINVADIIGRDRKSHV